MQLLLEVKNPVEIQLLLQYIRLLSSAKVIGEPQPAATTDSNPKKSFFDRHYGSLKSHTTLEEIDNQLLKLRQEWERDTW